MIFDLGGNKYRLVAHVSRHWPIDPPDAVDAIHYRMETGRFSQADLGRLLGSRQRASEILNRKRPLTMRMASRLHWEWGVPAEALLGLDEADQARQE